MLLEKQMVFAALCMFFKKRVHAVSPARAHYDLAEVGPSYFEHVMEGREKHQHTK